MSLTQPADTMTLAEAVTYQFTKGKGYDTASVDQFRSAAIDTIDSLEAAVARLRVENAALRKKLTASLTPESIARALALLAIEMRTTIGPNDPASRELFGAVLSAIITSKHADMALSAAEKLPGLTKDLLAAQDNSNPEATAHTKAVAERLLAGIFPDQETEGEGTPDDEPVTGSAG